MTDFVDNSAGQEHDVDAIIAQAYGPAAPEAQQQQQAAPAAPQEPQYKEYSFPRRGQEVKIKENDPRFQQWLSYGADYDSHISSFKQKQQEFEQQRQQFEQQWTPYKEIDEYARSNPDWWAHVDQSYQQRSQQQQQAVPPEVQRYLDQKLEPIAKDLPLMKEFLQEQQTLKLEKQRADEDAQLNQSMKSLQEKYSGLDFATTDESGLSLEARVLNHAVTNGFPTFRAAFLDYYSDQLEMQAEARGREAMQKEAEKRRKIGLLDDNGPASAPQQTPFNRKPQSWNDPSLRGDNIMQNFKF